MKIGFIGQGWIGKNLADHFEARDFDIVRFAKEAPHDQNEEALKECDIVFVAVPTPTTPSGFDDSILRAVLKYAQKGQSVVIKSTILPGTTDALAKDHPHLFVFHSPEFLREASVRKDIDEPARNIIGIPTDYFDDEEWQKRAEAILGVLPKAPHNSICRAPEAEITKYGGNNFLYMKVVFMNLLHDIAETHGASWDVIAENMKADPRIGESHMQPVHQYAHMDQKQGRGAGGHCFIKDFAGLRHHIERVRPDDRETIALLRAFEAKNNRLLQDSEKDLDLLRGVYGDSALCLCKVHGDHVDCTCEKSLLEKTVTSHSP
jgi:nucleotide sugar dehydrogenase